MKGNQVTWGSLPSTLTFGAAAAGWIVSDLICFHSWVEGSKDRVGVRRRTAKLRLKGARHVFLCARWGVIHTLLGLTFHFVEWKEGLGAFRWHSALQSCQPAWHVCPLAL